MANNEPAKQHIIPEMLSKRFCDDDGCLWAGSKSGREPFYSSPNGLFKEKHVYSTHDYNQTVRTYQNEAILGEMERKADPVISHIVDQARRRRPPGLSTEAHDTFKRFIAAQARRTPESQERIGLKKGVDDVYREAVTKCFNQGGLPIPGDDFFEDDAYTNFRETYKSNLPGNFAAGDHHLLERQTKQFCIDTGLLVALIDMPNRSFVIGSHGITIVDNHTWLPIAHDVAITVTPYPGKETLVGLNRNNESLIKTINRCTVELSRIIAGRSKELIESLMRGHWKRPRQ